MTTIQQPAAVDPDKLMSFVFRAVDEVGATLNTALVVMGDKLGLYRALADAALSPRPGWPPAHRSPSVTRGSGCAPRPRAASPTTTQTAGATAWPPRRRWR